jgi:hydrogenase/urease accessory protein HupE
MIFSNPFEFNYFISLLGIPYQIVHVHSLNSTLPCCFFSPFEIILTVVACPIIVCLIIPHQWALLMMYLHVFSVSHGYVHGFDDVGMIA